MKILLIEDNNPTAACVEKGLRQSGHEVDNSGDGGEGLILATTVAYDAAVVDRMLPGLDGLALVQTLRGAGIKTPVLFLGSSWKKVGELGELMIGLRCILGYFCCFQWA